MKSLNYTRLICGIALLLSACSDTSSSATSVDSTGVAETQSVTEVAAVSEQNTSISIPSVSEQEAAEPVDVSAIAGDPVIRFENDSVSIENNNDCITYKEKTVMI